MNGINIEIKSLGQEFGKNISIRNKSLNIRQLMEKDKQQKISLLYSIVFSLTTNQSLYSTQKIIYPNTFTLYCS